jgi:hypothetical protein
VYHPRLLSAPLLNCRDNFQRPAGGQFFSELMNCNALPVRRVFLFVISVVRGGR